jgi:NADH:ubiquinone oxidoreductase subunit 6 (subunit J)
MAAAGAAAVAFALFALVQRSLYGTAICLLVVLLQVALLFLLMGAQLLGFLQVLVYAGAIMVLLVVASMSSPARLEELWARLALPRAWAWGGFAVLALELGLFLRWAPAGAPFLGVTRELEARMAGILFGPHAVLTELVGALILVAALAALPEESA